MYLNWLPLTITVGVPAMALRSEFGIGPFSARVVAACTQARKRCSRMHTRTRAMSVTPAFEARAASAASSSAGVPSFGWSTNSAWLKSKKWSGENSATQAAALAARKEYCVPADLVVRTAIGWISMVAAPDSTQVRNWASFFSSKVPQLGQR